MADSLFNGGPIVYALRAVWSATTSGDRCKATYWISETYGAVLKSVITRAGRTRTELDTVEFKVNIPIEDAKFVYDPPDDATVLDAEPLVGNVAAPNRRRLPLKSKSLCH